MARIKVHELAKEIGISNKEVLDYLNGKGLTVRTAVSVVPEHEVDNIRKRYGKAVPASDAAKETDAQKSDGTNKTQGKSEGEGKKKSGIVRVIHTQNAEKKIPVRRVKAKPAEEPKQEAKEPVKAAQEEAAAPAPKKTEAAKEKLAAAPKKEAAAPKKEPAEKKVRETAQAEGADKAVNKAQAPAKKTEPAKEEPTAAAKEEKPAPEKKETEQRPELTGHSGVKILGHIDLNAVRKPASPRSSSGEKRNSQGHRIYTNHTGDRNQGRGGYQGRGGDRTGGQGRSGGFQGRGGQGARPILNRNNRAGQGGRGFGQGRPQTGPMPGGRGRGPAAPHAGGTDGALAHKTSRDFAKGSKEKDKNREERRENGRHGFANRPNQQRRTFNRVPKALQKKHNNAPQERKPEEVVTEIRVPERITIRDLAERMKIQASELVKELFMKGEMVTVNHEIPYEKAEEIALDHDILCEKEEKEDVIGELLQEEEEDEAAMVSRPPVVCVMGHVDHGKTSLLDAIRHTHVTEREAGGITQAIGAYMVSVKGQKITFLDTPGHEAFTAMRMRGANATDIAVLVVAADDGVMPQTVEAINHAKAANTEIIVAVNKIDKPGANMDRVKQELSEYGLIAEDWGGDTVFCPVSAKTHEGLDNLLEMILLSSEVKELKANPDRNARGIVLEAKLDKGRGPVASILIQKGTLHQGDFIACGAAFGKVRAMTDENGKRLHKATPSMPCEIIGLSDVPEAGEVLMAFDSDKEAKEFASVFVTEEKKNLLEGTRTQMSLDDLFSQIKEGSLKELPIVVKADVQGSAEAVSQSLQKLSNEEVVVKVIHAGVGAITESDVALAAASNAIIIGFAVRPDATAKSMADQQKVDIHLYNVIYEAIEDVERAIKGMRAAVYEEQVQGHVEIRQIFKASKIGKIAGSNVIDGLIQKNSKVRVKRGEEVLFDGDLASLRIGKDDVKEVKKGFDCGLVFAEFEDFEIGDIVEAYTMVEVERDSYEKKQSEKSAN